MVIVMIDKGSSKFDESRIVRLYAFLIRFNKPVRLSVIIKEFVDMSNVTVKRYLNYLVSVGKVDRIEKAQREVYYMAVDYDYLKSVAFNRVYNDVKLLLK